MTRVPRVGNRTEIREYLIERVSDLAGHSVPRKAAVAWLEAMTALIAVSSIVIIIRLSVK
jgi:hypothetical protein